MYQPGGSSSETQGSGPVGACPSESLENRPQNISGQNQPVSGEQTGMQPREEAGKALQDLGGKAAEVRERAKARARETVQSVSERARHEAGVMFQRARDQGKTILDRNRGRTAESISHFAAAVRESADRLRREGNHNLAGYAEDIGDQLDRAAQYLQEHDLRDMVNDLGNVVRRRPGLFFAGCLIGGLVAARFLKASQKSRMREEERALDRGPDWAGQPGYGEPAGVATAGASAGFQTQGNLSGTPGETMGTPPAPASPGISPGAPVPGSVPGGSPGMREQGF